MADARVARLGSGMIAGLLMFSVSASAQLSGSGPGSVGFLAVGPGGLEIKGQASQLVAREVNQKLELEVPLKELRTGIDLRDRHLRDYMHADQYPHAKLVIERTALTFPTDNAVSQGSAKGAFWLNGREHPLTFTYQAKRTGADYQVQALADVDIRDHGIEVPCYLKLCVDPLVKLKVKFTLRDQ